MNVLAVIPARGGSKGLIDKNILPLLGHPLIAYSIKAGLESNYINRVIVSTDSPIISEIALKYGAEVPFLRPREFAQDDSLDLDVFRHALKWLGEHEGYYPDIIVHLRPTSPVRRIDVIDECVRKFLSSSCDSLRVVTQSPISPYKMWDICLDNGYLKPLLAINHIAEPFNSPRQSLPITYWQIGTLDIIRPDTIINKNSMSGTKILPFLVSSEFAVDIDDLKSFDLASSVISSSNFVQFND